MAKQNKLIKKTLFDYKVKNDDTIVICGFLGDPNVKKLTVPDKINGYDVTDISGDAFDNCKSIETLSLPERLNYLNASLVSDLKKLKCIILNNPDIEVESDTFVSNMQLKYIVLHKKLYNTIANDDYPCISGKVSFDKYGINPRITQLIPFDSSRTNTHTADNMITMYHDALLNYNMQLSLFDRLKAAFNKSNVLLFDEQGNSESTIAAYDYIKAHVRNALSKDDETIIRFLTDFSKVIHYDDYNSFETFDKKIDECLYILFINAVESNRLSVLKQWIDIEFQRYNFVHKKRNEFVVIFFNQVFRKLSDFLFEIQNPSNDDFKVVTSYFFSNITVSDDDVYRLIDYINKSNLEEEIDSEEVAQMCSIYTENKQFSMNEVASRCMLWGFYNHFFDVSDFIDFYSSVEDLEETEQGKTTVEIISLALENQIAIPSVMDFLVNLSENDGTIDSEKLNVVQKAICDTIGTNDESSLSMDDVNFILPDEEITTDSGEAIEITKTDEVAGSKIESQIESVIDGDIDPSIEKIEENIQEAIEEVRGIPERIENDNYSAFSDSSDLSGFSDSNENKNFGRRNKKKKKRNSNQIMNVSEETADEKREVTVSSESISINKEFVNDDPLDISLVKDID